MEVQIKDKILSSKEGLISSIKKLIKNNKDNIKLQRKLNEKFMKKGIDNSTVFPLFKGDMEVEQLEDDIIRLICLCEGIIENISSDYLYQNNIKVKPEDYFSDGEILKYKLYQKPKEELITSLNLENVRRINKYEYEVYMNAEYLSKLRKSGLPKYFGELQRPLKVVSKGGEIRKKSSIDKENLKELTNRFLGLDKNGNKLKDESYDLITTAISMFSIWQDGKEPFFVWEGEDKPNSIGTLDITPIFDSNSINYCPFIIPDGYHRFTAICDAFDIMEKEGKYLDKGFVVHIVLAKVERTKQFISDTFKRTDLKKDVKEAITKNPLNDALDVIIDNCYVLKNNVSNTFDDYKAYNSLTYRNIMLKALRLTNLDFSKKFIISSRMSKIGKIVSGIFENFESKDVSRKDDLYQSGMFAGYIAIANTILEVKQDIDYDLIAKISNMLINISNKKILSDYGIKNKNVKVKELYKMLTNFTMEVINNENKR